jgi:hypothetical protein
MAQLVISGDTRTLVTIPSTFAFAAMQAGIVADRNAAFYNNASNNTEAVRGDRVSYEPDGSLDTDAGAEAMLFGFSKPHGFAVIVTRDARTLHVHPENITKLED